MLVPTNGNALSGDCVQAKAKKIIVLLFGWGFILLGVM
jgi:hypothetical protein